MYMYLPATQIHVPKTCLFRLSLTSCILAWFGVYVPMLEESTHPDMPEVTVSQNKVHTLVLNLRARKAAGQIPDPLA